MIYNRNSIAIFTYVASPTKSSAVPVSLSISLINKSVVRSDTVKTKFSFHSGLVPFPVCMIMLQSLVLFKEHKLVEDSTLEKLYMYSVA